MHRIFVSLIAFLLYGGGAFGGNGNMPKADTTVGKRQHTDAPLLTKNILTFAPIRVLENAYGFGIGLEHFTGKNGALSIYVPIVSTYDVTSGSRPRRNQTTYVMPGLKFYLSKPATKIKCAIGPSLLLGVGQTVEYDEFRAKPAEPVQKTVLGTLVNTSVNINPFPHIYYGFELGCGFTYFEKVGDRNIGAQSLVQFGFNFGYRF